MYALNIYLFAKEKIFELTNHRVKSNNILVIVRLYWNYYSCEIRLNFMYARQID